LLTSSSIIGGFVAYYLGRTNKTIFRRLHKKPKKQDEEKSHGLLTKYGRIAIFFCSWIPVLGDVIPIVAGTKKYDFRKFAIAMSVGKAIKVLAIVHAGSFFTTSFLP
jgi:membrane protein YqaA with SNARE-associated domain